MGPPPGSTCAVHPLEQAVEVCARCGNFVCADCLVLVEAQALCTACRRRTAGLLGGSWVSIAAAICGFAGIACAPLGLVALLLAAVDLLMIATGRSRKGGVTLDLLALAMGVVGLVLGAFMFWRLSTGQVHSSDFE